MFKLAIRGQFFFKNSALTEKLAPWLSRVLLISRLHTEFAPTRALMNSPQTFCQKAPILSKIAQNGALLNKIFLCLEIAYQNMEI
jgi:hypothetical protein